LKTFCSKIYQDMRLNDTREQIFISVAEILIVAYHFATEFIQTKRLK